MSGPATRPLAFAAMRGALQGRDIRPQVFFLEARDEVLIRRFSETRHRHPLADQRASRARSPRSAGCWSRSATRPTSSSTPRTSRCASCASGSSRASAGAAGARRLASSSSASASSTACRWRPTSSSTSASCRTRTTSRSCGTLSGLTEPVREFVLAQPPTGRSWRSSRVPRFRRPRVRRRGQDAAHDRDRLHRWLPPLDRDRRGDRRLAAPAGLGPVAVFHRELERS